jgi:hypothetical protein
MPPTNPLPRQSGTCRPVFALVCWLVNGVLVAALTAPVAQAATSQNTAPLVPSSSRAATPGGSSTSPEIAAAEKQVATLKAKLHSLQVQKSDLKAQEPRDPGKNASESARKKYKQDHATWQTKVDKVQHQIDSVQTQINAAEKKLRALKGETADPPH